MRMQERKKLSDTLNLRIDEALAGEVERFAKTRGTTASEAARKLIEHGVAVARKLEAQRLQSDYRLETAGYWKRPGYVEIEARYHVYTPVELAAMEDEIS